MKHTWLMPSAGAPCNLDDWLTAILNSELTTNARALAYLIAHYLHDGETNHNHHALARGTATNPADAHRILTWLAAHGWITATTNGYTPSLPAGHP